MADVTLLLGPRVAEHAQGGSRLWALGLDVPDVVSFAGSLVTGADLATADRLAQRFVARLLDRGSERLDRFEIADWLERRGAQLSFSSREGYVAFRGRALRTDVADVLALAAELLATPRFESEEVEKVRRELGADVREARADTSYLAGAALSRHVFAPGHPGYRLDLDARAAQLATLTRDDLARFHRARVASEPVLLALAGDLTGLSMPALLAPFPDGEAKAYPVPPPVHTRVAGRTEVEVPDKPNLDVRMGQGVELTRHDAAFLPLMAGVHALGGNFSARLMQEVRDRRGLTYGIRAGLERFDQAQQGQVAIRATFSTADLHAGIDATDEVVRGWVEGGLEAAELESVVETLVGSYDVSLSTTRGLASRLLTRAEQGFAPDYLDAYRDELRALALPDVNDAVRRYVRPDALHVATAGTHPDPAAGTPSDPVTGSSQGAPLP